MTHNIIATGHIMSVIDRLVSSKHSIGLLIDTQTLYAASTVFAITDNLNHSAMVGIDVVS